MNGEHLTQNKQPGQNEKDTLKTDVEESELAVDEQEPEFQSFSGDIGIETRLSGVPTRLEEPLSATEKKEILALALSDSVEDVTEYANRRAALSEAQAAEFNDYREYKVLSDMQQTNPDAFNLEISKLAPERRSAFYDFAKNEHDEAGEVKREVTESSEPEKEFLLLHSLKFTQPEQFAEAFNQLSSQQKGAFDAFEAKEDAGIKSAHPEVVVPKLSVDGETWIQPEVKAKTITDALPDEPYKSAEELQADGKEQYQEHRAFVDSVTVPDKPSRWAKVKGWFSRKR